MQGKQVVLEPSGDHVEANPPLVQVAERCDHFCHRVGMHIDWLHGDQGHQLCGVLKDDLGQDPRIEQTVVRIDKNSLASRLIAPAGNLGDPPDVLCGLGRAEGRTGCIEVHCMGTDVGHDYLAFW